MPLFYLISNFLNFFKVVLELRRKFSSISFRLKWPTPESIFQLSRLINELEKRDFRSNLDPLLRFETVIFDHSVGPKNVFWTLAKLFYS